jgi:hypothetical protein
MKYPNKAIINEKGLFLKFIQENGSKSISENNFKNQFASEFNEVEITEENFKQIKEIQKLQGAPVLIDGAFLDKKAEITNFVVSSN